MKTKLAYTWRVMIALILAVSLGLVFAAPASALATDPLVVSITDPTGTPEEVCVGDTFTVTAEVENTDASYPAYGVNLTISLPAGMSLVSPGAEQPITEDPLATSTNSSTVSWTVQCDDPGDGTIDVDVTAFEDTDHLTPWTGGYTADSVDIQQQQAELVVTISSPAPATTITECQDFNLVFDVDNIGNVEARGVTVSINPGAYAEVDSNGEGVPVLVYIGDIAGGETAEDVTVLMHCTGSGATTITVTPAGTDGCSDEPIALGLLTSDSETVTQEGAAELVVTIDVPEEDYLVCDNFTATVTVENIGDEDASDVILRVTVDGVHVEIAGGGTFADVTFPDVNGGDPPQSGTVTLHCMGAGLDSPIYLTVVGGTADNTGADLTGTAADSVEVNQYNPAELEVTVDTDEIEYNVCQDITVTVAVNNIAGFPGETAEEVVPDLTVTGLASWVSGPTPAMADILAGDWQVFVYVYHCDGAGTVNFEADALGTGAMSGDPVTPAATDDVDVDQVLPDITITITTPIDDDDTVWVNQNFQVFAVISNTSGGTLTDVEGTLKTGANYAWVSGDNPQNVGDLDDGESATVSWWVQCTHSGATTIAVSADCFEGATDTDTAGISQIDPTHPCLSTVIKLPTKAFVSQTFSVHAEITNDCQETAKNVTATLEIGDIHDTGTAALVDEESYTKELGDIAPGVTYTAEWTVHCTGAGLTTFTVTPAGYDDITGDLIPGYDISEDSGTVLQVVREGIEVVITSPSDYPEPEKWGPACGSNFIYFTVTNTGYADLTDVTVTLSIAGNAEIHGVDPDDLVIDVGDLDQHGDYSDYFTVDCTGEDNPPDYTTFTVTAEGTSDICEDVVSHSDSVEVYQKYLIVEIASVDSEYCIGADIPITFTVTNCYTEDLGTVRAVITFDGPVALDGTTPNPTINVNGATLDSTETVTMVDAWHLECTGTGVVTVNIYVSGIYDAVTISNEDEITFKQVDGPVLEATIDTAACDWVTVDSTYEVTSTITNSGDGTATGVQPTLTFVITGEAVGTGDGSNTDFELDYDNVYPGSETIYKNGVPVAPTGYALNDATGEITFNTAPGAGVAITADYKTKGPVAEAEITTTNPDWTTTLSPGELAYAEWRVHCTGPTEASSEEDCAIVMSVEVAGSGVCGPVSDSSGTLTVNQFPLSVTIEADPPDGITTGMPFSIDAIIKNVGGGDTCPCEIENVTATISFLDDNSSLAGGEEATKTIGTVPWNIEQPDVDGMKAQWTVVCEHPGTTQIMVTVSTTYAGCPLSVFDTITLSQGPAYLTYSVPLAKDWNYMSIPVFPLDSDIDEVLYDITGFYTEVWSYVGQEWQLYVPGQPDAYYTALGIDKITDIEPGIGYIIRMIFADTINDQGYELNPGAEPPPTYDLFSGWNLTGFKTMDFDDSDTITQAGDTMRVGYYLANTDANYNGVIIGQEVRFLRYYEPGAGWQELAQAAAMWIGKGYWLWASESGLVIVPPVVEE